MTTEEIAHRLVELCRGGKNEQAQKELFSKDVISIEPMASPAFEKETKGLDAILEKGKKFQSMMEKVHQVEVSEPVISKQSFACRMRIVAKMKERGEMDEAELCVYKVKDGKIISEEFIL